jgi:hypothetical protein
MGLAVVLNSNDQVKRDQKVGLRKEVLWAEVGGGIYEVELDLMGKRPAI